MIVLDTNVVSEAWRSQPDPNVLSWLERQDHRELFLCVPVIAELAYGGNRILLRDRSTRYISALQSMFDGGYRNRVLNCDRAAALKFGEVAAAREGLGRPMESMDAMIAAICIVHGARLATRNVRDFVAIELNIINPFEAGA